MLLSFFATAFFRPIVLYMTMLFNNYRHICYKNLLGLDTYYGHVTQENL